MIQLELFLPNHNRSITEMRHKSGLSVVNAMKVLQACNYKAVKRVFYKSLVIASNPKFNMTRLIFTFKYKVI